MMASSRFPKIVNLRVSALFILNLHQTLCFQFFYLLQYLHFKVIYNLSFGFRPIELTLILQLVVIKLVFVSVNIHVYFVGRLFLEVGDSDAVKNAASQ